MLNLILLESEKYYDPPNCLSLMYYGLSCLITFKIIAMNIPDHIMISLIDSIDRTEERYYGESADSFQASVVALGEY